ncbi:MAG: hypothetical protein AUG49_12195 [Catenulispora sp. 13_1_20CM_3_70_7]|nr:MAG: hypothetical protein AUG49_12195 [Catenulispora sp. 13_1_20CM_3_70_7]
MERRLPEDFFAAALRDDVLKGLTADPKWLPPKWVYDARGSELFEEITRLLVFLGGTIGNLLPEERSVFLGRVRAGLRPGEWLLLGTDLVKDPDTLVAAYDDAAGVTAEFNKNVLAVVDRELNGDFDPNDFEHVALWDPRAEWIEMRLRARRELTVRLRELDLVVSFDAGEELRTEISAKFRREGVERELAAAGFALRQWWTDSEGRFGLSLAEAV